MRFIKFRARDGYLPIFVARDAVVAVAECQMHDPDQRKIVGTGHADILVQGEWFQLEHSPADVMRMLGEGIAA